MPSAHVAQGSSEALTQLACFDLLSRDAESSASLRINETQRHIFGCTSALMLIALAQWPGILFLILIFSASLVFLAVAALRLVSIPAGLKIHAQKKEADTSIAPIPDDMLPVYTIMVPMFHEARVLPRLIASLEKIDYPKEKLEIFLLFEEEDHETIRVCEQLVLDDRYHQIIIPPSYPQTKPKACNYALPLTSGDLLVVYDAEDDPPPDQIRKAAALFLGSDEKLACLQARLNFFNWHENWLTRQFAIEYGVLYDLLLPALVSADTPIPLGGTSTHFRTSALRTIGAWDPYNVTEDADLGYRFAARGYGCGFFHSTTLEEANCELPNWLRQRTRWLKGWMQTYLVRMRHPVTFCRTVGLRGFIVFQIMMGGLIISSLVHPLFYLILILDSDSTLTLNPGSGLNFYFTFVLLFGYAATIAAGMVAALMRGRVSLLLSCLTTPLCWLLISVAAYRAVLQLITSPFHWEKTTHGLSRVSREDSA
ncbi:MAG: glycosyltransferase [Parvibaculaceae bacterium]|nr:glycosyltransferase [Parvibaculaceae bacterium]